MSGTPDLNQILIFVRVVQAGGFSAAARLLGTPKSTVSRKVAELEERLGARLLQRTTRRFGLTDAGRLYYARVAPMVGELEEAERAVGQLSGSPRGLLRVTAPLAFSELGPVVAEYVNKNPDVQVDMVCTDRQVDLVEERFDVAIRAGQLSDSTLVARSLGAQKALIVAAPSYIKRHGTPRAPQELATHACIAFGVGAAPNVWNLDADGKRTQVRINPRFTVNDLAIARAAALDGVGVAWLPERLCKEDIRKRRLVHLIPDWCSPPVPVHALYPTGRQLSPKVVAFVELLAARLRVGYA